MRTFFLAVLCSCFCGMTPVSHSDDWPEFYGPNRDNISKETGINKNWDENPPKELWSVDTGPGFGGAGIADGKVYILDRKDDQQDVLRCFDLKSGEELWNHGYDAPGKPSYNGSRSTPTVDGNYIYTVGVFGHVYSFDAETHKPVWNKSFEDDFGSHAPNWAFSQSPVRYKDLLIVAPMSESCGMAGLNAKTGEIVWQSPDIGSGTYMSPTLYTIHGKDQFYIQTRVGEQMQFTSIDPDNGEILWKLIDDSYFNKIPIPNPIHISEGVLFVTGGYDAGSCLLAVEKDGDKWSAAIRKLMPNYGAQIHAMIYHDGYLYGNLNTNENLRSRRTEPDGLACINTEGGIVWQTKGDLPINRGALLFVDDVLLALGDEDGFLHMIEATHEGYNKIGSHKVFTDLQQRDNNIWAPMALADGKLVIRSQSKLKCFDLK